MKKYLKFYASGLLVSQAIWLSGCAVWHKIQSPPPQYTVYPTLSLKARLSLASQSTNQWNGDYEYAVTNASPWKPDADLLAKTYPDVANEFDQQDRPDQAALPGLASDTYCQANDGISSAAFSMMTNRIRQMFDLTDQEQAGLFVDNPGELAKAPRYTRSYFLSTRLPTTTSAVLPVGVSVTPVWQSSPADSSAKTANTNQESVVLDKLLLTVQAASSAQTNSQTGEKSAPAPDIADFQPQQKVTVNVSTVLNSPSVLDRIEYVSTYVYVFPWQNSPDCDGVLERELWRSFFELNSARDPLIQTNMARNDMRRAIEDMRVRVCDIGTTVQYDPIDLGSLTQTTSDTTGLGLSGTLSALAPPTLPALNATANYAGVLNTVANISLKQQLDQRSTFIDPPRDFFRITQRGMQSVNLAGRFKEIVTLNIPAAEQPIRVLIPKPKNSSPSPGTNAPAATGAMTNTPSASAPAGETGKHLQPGTDVAYEESTISAPLYSRVEAFTFSVVVAREATHLLHSSRDRYGLDDARSAFFIADVTPPQLITLWQWERTLDNIQTWDIFGKRRTPSQNVYITTYEGETPFPLVLLNFTPQQRHDLLEAINEGSKTNPLPAIGSLQFGLADDEEYPTKLKPLISQPSGGR